MQKNHSCVGKIEDHSAREQMEKVNGQGANELSSGEFSPRESGCCLACFVSSLGTFNG